MTMDAASRREFLRTVAMGSAGLALSSRLSAAAKKSVLLFTKSSGFEHNVVKTTPAVKQAFRDAVHRGLGYVGSHAAADTFHTEPDTKDLANRYIAHGEQSDPYLRMIGGEFIIHGRDPRLQTTDVIINDPKFPGLEGVSSPVSFTDEWYSLKDFMTDMHVILTLDTKGMKGEPYQRPPY